MSGFFNELKVQRLTIIATIITAASTRRFTFRQRRRAFLCAYVMAFSDPAMAALIGWLIAMTTRQVGHSSSSRAATIRSTMHRRLQGRDQGRIQHPSASSCCSLSGPPRFSFWFSIQRCSGSSSPCRYAEFIRHVGEVWLVVGLAGIAFARSSCSSSRIFDRTGVVTKIATDPFHDIKLYHRAPLHLLAGKRAAGAVSHPLPEPCARRSTRRFRQGPQRRAPSGQLPTGRPDAWRAAERPWWRPASRAEFVARSPGRCPSAPVSTSRRGAWPPPAARKRSATASKSAFAEFRLKDQSARCRPSSRPGLQP